MPLPKNQKLFAAKGAGAILSFNPETLNLQPFNLTTLKTIQPYEPE